MKSVFKSDFRWALVLAVVWQIAFLFVGFLMDTSQGLLGHMVHWDAGWYKHVIEKAYSISANPASPAFYPLYPFLVSAVTTLSFGLVSLEVSGLIINTASLWLLLVAFVRILRHFRISKYGIVAATALLFCFPSAFFMHVLYTEAMFMALGFWAYLFALERKWWAVGTILAVLTASRLPSVLFILLCGLEYLKAYSWNIKKSLNKNVLWFLLAPLGFIAYGLFLYFVRGDFLAMFAAYSATDDWTYHVFNLNILSTIATAMVDGVNGLINEWAYDHLVNRLLPVVSIFSIFAASIYLYFKEKKKGIPLAIFGLASIILFSLNGNVVSVHRYALACIVLYVAIGLFAKTKRRMLITIGLCLPLLALQMFLYMKFVSSIFAG